MKTNNENKRRQFLRNTLATGVVAGGAAASGQWTKPAVQSVVLPAHAATSSESFAVGFSGSPFVTSNSTDDGSTLIAKAMDKVISPASADDSVYTTEIVILPLGGTSYSFEILTSGAGSRCDEYFYFNSILSLGASSTTLFGSYCNDCGPCFREIEKGSFQLISVTPGINAVVSIDGSVETVPFVANPSTLSDPCSECEEAS